MALTGKWKAEWLSKKKIFEAETGKKKPSTKYLGYFRQGSGVSKAFAAMDATYSKIKANAPGAKRIKAQDTFEMAIKAAEKTGAAYIKLLDKELAKEGNDAENKPLKKTIAPLLDILKSDIDLCLTSARAQLEINRGASDADGKMNMAKATDIRQFYTRLPTNLKEAAMWIKVQDRNPDVKAFNAGVKTAARGITQNLKNIELRLKKGTPQQKEADALVKTLLPFANGGRQLKNDEKPSGVTMELAALKGSIANIAKWHKNMDVILKDGAIDDII